MIHVHVKSKDISNTNSNFIVSLDGKIKQLNHLFMFGPGSKFKRSDEDIKTFNLEHNNGEVSASQLLKEGGYSDIMLNEDSCKLSVRSLKIQSDENGRRYINDTVLEFSRNKKNKELDGNVEWILVTKIIVTKEDIQNIIKYLNHDNQNEIGVTISIKPHSIEKYVKLFSTGPNFFKPDNDQIYYNFHIDSDDIEFEIYYEFQGVEYRINNY